MSMIIEENIMVPMRDGVKLATDIYRPEREGQWPVLLTRLPYNKDRRFPFPQWKDKRLFLELNLDVERVVEAGYVIVAQDTRGRYASEGTFEPFVREAADGADCIAWAANQSWSNGQIGMYGVSYQGMTQWRAAREQPAALRAIAPSQVAGWQLYPYQGGAFLLDTALTWTLQEIATPQVQRQVAQGEATSAEAEEMQQAAANLPALLRHLPLTDMPLLQKQAPYYLNWLAHPTLDAYWQEQLADELHEQVQIPVLTIAGWYDVFLPNDLDFYQRMKQHGGNSLARAQQHLVIGPWSHGNFLRGFHGRDYGAASLARDFLTDLHLRWYDHWLKGQENGIEQAKPVRIFVMGANLWREEESWPLPDTHYCPYYLHSQGNANTAAGDGRLSSSQGEEEPGDVYQYNPRNPVPTVSGSDPEEQGELGPFDQRAIETREDVLCYTTPALEQPVEVTGPIELLLYVSSSAPDTDFTGKLIDVYPDGRAEILTDGILRARYRQSYTEPELMVPGQIYQLTINLGATSNVFLPGHRIRLEVSSSNFPRFDRNPNTGTNVASARQ
ncbi:MAG TPA: CocE/NonD family hydrolase, partial [Ktedonobacteraceae bacterium]|nr:CocE/NonD family hydrolase [Ktedonobacteraceae bacterium]